MTLRKVKRHPSRAPASKNTDIDHDNDALMTAVKTRELLGNCSEMHIWRLLNVESYAKLRFPRPIKINERNYWRRRDILVWIKAQEQRTQKGATR